MADVLVTVPKSFGLDRWISEGDAAGEPHHGQLYAYWLWGAKPDIKIGERVYCCYNGRLIGYAPLIELQSVGMKHGLVRGGDAVAVTIPERIQGFRGFRYRWWDRAIEVPFPHWRNS